MKPLQVYVDDTELERLEGWARGRGMTKSQAIRAAIRALTRVGEDDPLLSLSGMVHDRLPRDCRALVAEPPAAYVRRRRRAPARARR